MTDQDVMTAPVLHTSRLRLRPLAPLDLGALWAVTGHAGVVANYVDGPWTYDGTARFIDACAAAWGSAGYGRWGVELRATDGLVGYCGLSDVDWLPAIEPAVELSFRIYPDHWGVGLGPEAASAALGWAFTSTALGSVVACAVEANDQSHAALGKVGMRYERTLPYRSAASGVDAQFRVSRVTRQQWAAAS